MPSRGKMQPQTTGAAIAWETLPDPDEVLYERITIRRDIEAETPPAIRERVQRAYDASTSNGKPKFFNQLCGTAEAAQTFLRLLKVYAKSRGWTARATVVNDSTHTRLIALGRIPAATPPGTVVTYSVRPMETRRRISDSEKADICKELSKIKTYEQLRDIANRRGVSMQTLRKIGESAGLSLPVGSRGRTKR